MSKPERIPRDKVERALLARGYEPKYVGEDAALYENVDDFSKVVPVVYIAGHISRDRLEAILLASGIDPIGFV